MTFKDNEAIQIATETDDDPNHVSFSWYVLVTVQKQKMHTQILMNLVKISDNFGLGRYSSSWLGRSKR